MQERKAEISRVTGETNVHISLDLDRKGTDPYRDWFF